MCDCGEKLFFYLYPSDRKEIPDENKPGLWLRCMLLIAVVVHMGLSFFSLAIVGFYPLVINLIQASWSYSCQLTMRERQIVIYLVLLLVQMVI